MRQARCLLSIQGNSVAGDLVGRNDDDDDDDDDDDSDDDDDDNNNDGNGVFGNEREIPSSREGEKISITESATKEDGTVKRGQIRIQK